MPTSYKCDLCNDFESDNLNEFYSIIIQKYPGKPIELLLCEEKCFKLFRKFWKDADKELQNI